MDVLVVDDQIVPARTFAGLIEAATGLRSVYTDDPAEALELVATHSIGVVVLDQRMPTVSGTDLFVRIRHIDPKVQAIMLTSQARREEVGDALNRGFAAFVSKLTPEPLPDLVLSCLAQYRAELARETLALDLDDLPVLMSRRTHRWSRRAITDVRLLRLDRVDQNVVFPDSWTTVERIDSTATIVYRAEIETTDEVVLDVSEEEQLLAGIKMPVTPMFGANLRTEIARHARRATVERRAERRAVEKNYSLPKELADRDKPQLRAREFQEAPSYTKVCATLLIDCQTCAQRSFVKATAYVFDGYFMSRQVDHYSDGAVRQIDTGGGPKMSSSGEQ